MQGSGAAVLNSSSYWRCAFVGFDVFSVATILDSGDATCVMPGIRSSIVSSGSVLSLHLVSSEGSVLDGGSVVVIGDVGLVGVTPGLVGTGALFRFLLTGAFSWGFGIRAVDAVCSAGEFVGSLDIVGSDLAACDVELPSSAKGRLPFNVRLTGSNVSLSSVSVDVTAVGTMTTLAVEPSVVSGASLSVVTVHGDGFIRAAALTCRVGKADNLHAVFVSPSIVECPLPVNISGNISVSVVGSVGSATLFLHSNLRPLVGSNASAELSLQFQPDSLQPISGHIVGGNIVTIHGSFLNHAASVGRIQCRFGASASGIVNASSIVSAGSGVCFPRISRWCCFCFPSSGQ